EQVLGQGRRERDDPVRPLGGAHLVRGRREGDDGQRGAKGREDGDRTAKHESSFREGFGLAAGGRSSDSGLPPPPPSRVATQWLRGGRASPLTAAGPSRTCTGVPSPLTVCERES